VGEQVLGDKGPPLKSQSSGGGRNFSSSVPAVFFLARGTRIVALGKGPSLKGVEHTVIGTHVKGNAPFLPLGKELCVGNVTVVEVIHLHGFPHHGGAGVDNVTEFPHILGTADGDIPVSITSNTFSPDEVNDILRLDVGCHIQVGAKDSGIGGDEVDHLAVSNTVDEVAHGAACHQGEGDQGGEALPAPFLHEVDHETEGGEGEDDEEGDADRGRGSGEEAEDPARVAVVDEVEVIPDHFHRGVSPEGLRRPEFGDLVQKDDEARYRPGE